MNNEEQKSPSNLKTLLTAIIISLGVGVIIGFFIDQRGAKTAKFKLTNGDQELVIDLDQEQISEENLLNQIFSEDWTKDATTAWLRNKEEIFHFKHLDLTESIKKINPNNDTDRRISENFRELSRRRFGPWNYQTDTIKIGFPMAAPKEGKAYGCENGNFYRERVKLYSFRGRKEVIVEVSNRYECPDGFEVPDLQISREDRKKLFGDTPVGKTEQVFALILND